MWEKLFVLVVVIISAVSAQNQCQASEECIPFDDCESAYAKQLTDNYASRDDYKQLLMDKFCGNNKDGEQLICCSDKKDDPYIFIHPSIGLLPNTLCGLIDSKKDYTRPATEIGQFPWMAYLEYSDPKVQCTGTLITSRYVLTPGQCLNGSGFTPDSVVLGDYTDKNPRNSERTQVIPVESVIVHRKFGTSGLDYDIGLIRLTRHADMSKETIKTICLPITDFLNKAEYTSLKLLENERGANNIPGKILQKEVRIMEKDQCLAFYSARNTQPGDAGFCALDSCEARIGNPVIKNLQFANAKEIRFIQYGFVIKVLKDCKNDSPVIYQSVVHHMFWILNNLKP